MEYVPPIVLMKLPYRSDYTLQKEREARRTVYVDNLNPFLTAEHILNYFQFCGDIRYLRIGGDWMEKKRYVRAEEAPFSNVCYFLWSIS